MRRSLQWLFWLCLAAGIATKIVEWRTESWWFEAAGYGPVYGRMMAVRGAAFLAGGLLFGLVQWVNVRIAWRIAQNSDAPLGLDDTALSVSRLIRLEDKLHLDRYRGAIAGGTLAFLTLLAAQAAATQWAVWLRYFQAVEVGQTDPIFGRDLGFYLFRLPALNFAWGFVLAAGLCALLLVTALYAYEEVFELGGKRARLATPAVRHVAALGAALLVWKALGYRLSAFNLLTAGRGPFTGPFYVDIHWRLPLLSGLAVVAILAAGLMLWWGRRGDARHALWALAGYLLASWLIGMGLPALVQRRGIPDDLEAPFVRHHVAATRRAFGLDNIRDWQTGRPLGAIASPTALSPNAVGQTVDAAPSAPLDAATLRAAVTGLPAWPPQTLHDIFNERFKSAGRYELPGLSFDRYRIDGQWRPVAVAARELPRAPDATTWHALHMQWTHGDGVALCDAHQTAANGQPLFYLQPAPSPNAPVPNATPAPLTVRRPELYYGEFRTTAWEDMMRRRWDNAGKNSGGAGDANAAPSNDELSQMRPLIDPLFVVLGEDYNGRGGVPVQTRWRRRLLAWRFFDWRLARDPAVMLSSRVEWHRRLVERCVQLAPFLTFADPCPVVTEAGRIVWLLDGLALSNAYPYAQALPELGGANYLRNPVKATVDAYDGTVNFYVTDASDPFLRLYQQALPGLFQPLDKMPAELRRHAHYPAPVLWLQARLWTRYHATGAATFLAGQDEWTLLAARQSEPGRSEVAWLPNFALLAAPGDHLEKGLAEPDLFAVNALSRESNPSATSPPDKNQPAIVALLLAAGDYAATEAGQAPPRLYQWRPRVPLAPPEMGSTAPAVAPAGPALVAVQGERATTGKKPLVRTVTLLAPGATAQGDSVEAALAELSRQTGLAPRATPTPTAPLAAPTAPRMAPGVTPSSTSAPSNAAAVLAQARLAQARAEWAAMQQALARRDWAAYAAAQKRLDAILNRRARP